LYKQKPQKLVKIERQAEWKQEKKSILTQILANMTHENNKKQIQYELVQKLAEMTTAHVEVEKNIKIATERQMQNKSICNFILKKDTHICVAFFMKLIRLVFFIQKSMIFNMFIYDFQNFQV